MRQIIYIHGGSAYSQNESYLEQLRTMSLPVVGERPKRWSDSLAEDLGEGYEVLSPQMPNKYNSQYQEWKIWFERYTELLTGPTILIGWSQGGMFLAKYLVENEITWQIDSLYLVAAPFEAADFHGEDGGDFIFDTSQLSALSAKAPKIVIAHSEDDFVVPYEHALKYQQALPAAEFMSFSDRNHFLLEDFPELIANIKQS